MELLSGATEIIRRECVLPNALIKQVIVRSPEEIKSLLLQAAGKSNSWNEFVKEAQNSAWVAFPERIINEVG